MTTLIIFAILLTGTSASLLDGPVMQTSTAILTGSASASGHVESYLGIPYAQPPIEDLRFKKAQSLDFGSTIIRDAKKFGPSCVQMGHSPLMINPLLDVNPDRMVSFTFQGNLDKPGLTCTFLFPLEQMSEDCLYLNVFRPTNAANLPIVVFIPGEGFDFADAAQFDGSILAQSGDVIVITVQYRIGVFGFLQTTDGVADGNMGLSDILEALRWTKLNAKSIGGDASKITIFGRFSGSMAASLLLTSPVLRRSDNYSLPLFNRAILSSGIAVSDWTLEADPTKRSRDLIESLSCETTECLMTKSEDEILAASSFGWRPTVDHVIVEQEPLKELSKGHIAEGVTDVMIGRNEVDGTICLLTHWAMQSKYFSKLVMDDVSKKDLVAMIKMDIDIYSQGRLDFNEALRGVLKTGKKQLREKYLDFCSQSLIHNPSKKFAKQLKNIKSVRVFEYEFQERAPESIVPSFVETAGHGDDIIYALGLIQKSREATQQQKEISTLFMQVLSNFLETGNPDPANSQGWTAESLHLINQNSYSFSNSTQSCSYDMSSPSIVSFFSSHDYSSWQLVNSLSL